MKKIFLVIDINFVVLCTLIVSTELLFQLVHAVKKGSFLLLSDPVKTHHTTLFERHPYLVGRLGASVAVHDKDKSITTTENRTRWTGSPDDDHGLVRVAILGGSTAFGTGVSDQDTWPAILQAMLGEQFSVINYGVPGYSTAEAIIQLTFLVPEKQPHIVVNYMGWNDIQNYHDRNLGADYYEHGMRQSPNLGLADLRQQGKLQSLKDTFATAWLVERIKQRISDRQGKESELFVEPDPFVDRIYVRNLKTLNLLAKNGGSFSVFAPQVLNYPDYVGKKQSRPWTKRIRDDAIPALMDRFNSLMEDACSQQDEDCVVLGEIVNENWQPGDFIDDGHFSRKGGVKFASILADVIRKASDQRALHHDVRVDASGASPDRK